MFVKPCKGVKRPDMGKTGDDLLEPQQYLYERKPETKKFITTRKELVRMTGIETVIDKPQKKGSIYEGDSPKKPIHRLWNL